MYNEYPDLIYEGIVYDLYNSYEFIEEGFSPKSIFKNILDILRRLGVRIRQFAISIKNKFMSLIHKIKNIITKNKNKKSEDEEKEPENNKPKENEVDEEENKPKNTPNNVRGERRPQNPINKETNKPKEVKREEPKNNENNLNNNRNINNMNKKESQQSNDNSFNKEDKKILNTQPEPKKKENHLEDYNWEGFVDNLINIEETYIRKDKDIDAINQNLYLLESNLMRYADESNNGEHFYSISGRGKRYKDEDNEILNKALDNGSSGYHDKLNKNIKICKDAIENLQDRPVYKSTEEFLNFVQGEKRPVVLNKETKENFNKVMQEVDNKMPKVVSSCSVSLRDEQEYLNKTIKNFEKIQEQVEHDYLPESFVKYFSNIKDIICKKYTLDLKLYNNILRSFSINFMQSIKIYEKIS